nr:unnamed protein product [Callosobruchus chinensis]
MPLKQAFLRYTYRRVLNKNSISRSGHKPYHQKHLIAFKGQLTATTFNYQLRASETSFAERRLKLVTG